MNVIALQNVEYLVAKKNGSTLPRIAKNLGLTERQVKYHIHTLRKSFSCPIGFDRHSGRYYYTVKGRCQLKFVPCKADVIADQVSVEIKRLLSL